MDADKMLCYWSTLQVPMCLNDPHVSYNKVQALQAHKVCCTYAVGADRFTAASWQKVLRLTMITLPRLRVQGERKCSVFPPSFFALALLAAFAAS